MWYEVRDRVQCGAFQTRDPKTAGQRAMAAQDGLSGTDLVNN
jgi:hypothetical protein